ncbi:N-acetylmuramoyl-L-alanine amidase [Melghirimyces thermohalophilus]|uniref:N-acetylmuramoyl-L-alanine amidase n=1 Tax=Melghirimyces thermohalophilus TaxID=1236220 RepID=A0A1G6KP88_9BACL|nr:N-acetylmuramoyl-L-alanine amidase [Melghirimyces thermohalophilus]
MDGTGESDKQGRKIAGPLDAGGMAGMVMVGNVGVNRVKACCLDFEDIRQIKEMIF